MVVVFSSFIFNIDIKGVMKYSLLKIIGGWFKMFDELISRCRHFDHWQEIII